MTGPAAQAPARRPPLLLVYAITVTGIMSNTLILPAIPDILDEFGQPDGSAGVLVAAGSLAGILVAPVIGGLADRFGRRRALVPCLVLFSAAGALGGLAPGFWLLVAARFVQGIGSAGLINLSVVLIGDHWDGEARARAIGRNSAVLTVSLALLPALGGLLTELGTWRYAFVPYLLGLVTALAAWRLLTDDIHAARIPVREQIRGAFVVLRRPMIAGPITAGVLVFVLIFGLFLATLPLLLEDEFGLGAGARGLVASAPAATATIVAFNVGRLQARLGRRRLILAGSLAFSVAFAIIGVAPALWLVLAGAMLYGLAEGAMIPTLQDGIVAGSPPESRGAVMAVFVSGARAGQTAGPLMAGVGIAVVGPSSTFLIGSALALALFVAAVAVLQGRSSDADGVGEAALT